jgi:hypothetical protein
MLRITREANGEVVFKVSGQLPAENVTEMETQQQFDSWVHPEEMTHPLRGKP